jgi:hypothetical protein
VLGLGFGVLMEMSIWTVKQSSVVNMEFRSSFETMELAIRKNTHLYNSESQKPKVLKLLFD